MNISKIDYVLPKNLIAQSPANPRDSSKLLIIDRKKKSLTHKRFFEITEFLTKNDCLVFNETKVFPARIIGKKISGGKVELILTRELNENTWEAIFGGKLKVGSELIFENLSGKVLEIGNYTAKVQFSENSEEVKKFIDKFGKTPLPPYINSKTDELELRRQYQTVYAKNVGSVAAPTAGFHFTENLLEKIRQLGVQTEYLTLNVGLGTFAPIKEDTVEKHQIHSESFFLPKDVAEKLNQAKRNGKRIIAVGTTTTRVLETCTGKDGLIALDNPTPSTNLYIYPPYKFKFVDALITNFHLPKSTLLLLVSSFVSFPNTNEKFRDFKSSLIGKAYQEAIKDNYKFYSFGDSSLII